MSNDEVKHYPLPRAMVSEKMSMAETIMSRLSRMITADLGIGVTFILVDLYTEDSDNIDLLRANPDQEVMATAAHTTIPSHSFVDVCITIAESLKNKYPED